MREQSKIDTNSTYTGEHSLPEKTEDDFVTLKYDDEVTTYAEGLLQKQASRISKKRKKRKSTRQSNTPKSKKQKEEEAEQHLDIEQIQQMHFHDEMTYSDVLLAGELRDSNKFNYKQHDKNATQAKYHFEQYVYDSITRELMEFPIGSPGQIIQLVDKHHEGRFEQIFGNTLDKDNVTDFNDLFNINPAPFQDTDTTNNEYIDQEITVPTENTTTNTTTNEQNTMPGLNDTTNNNDIHLNQQNTTTVQESATNDTEMAEEFHDTHQDS